MLHAPKQKRSRKTLERILSAARSLMAEHGVDAVGVTEIVSAAESSVGSFYARFDGKEDLVRALHERLWEEAGARWEDGLARWDHTVSAHDRVANLVGLLQETVRPDQPLRGALARLLDDEGSAAQAAFEARIQRDSVGLMEHESEIRHPDPATAVPMGVRIAMAALREQGAFLAEPPDAGIPPGPRDDGTDVLSPSTLRRELATALRGYWGIGRLVQIGPEPSETAVEYFDIWS